MLYVDVAVSRDGTIISATRVTAADIFSLGYLYAQYEASAYVRYGHDVDVDCDDIRAVQPAEKEE